MFWFFVRLCDIYQIHLCVCITYKKIVKFVYLNYTDHSDTPKYRFQDKIINQIKDNKRLVKDSYKKQYM